MISNTDKLYMEINPQCDKLEVSLQNKGTSEVKYFIELLY